MDNNRLFILEKEMKCKEKEKTQLLNDIIDLEKRIKILDIQIDILNSRRIKIMNNYIEDFAEKLYEKVIKK